MSDAAGLVAVDGAETFLGGAVVRELRARHVPVRAVVLAAGTGTPAADEVRAAPLGDADAIRKAVEGVGAVVMARKLLEEYPREGLTFAAVHAERTALLLDAASRAGVSRVVYVGTAGVEGGRPRTLAEAEARAEDALAAAKVPALCLKTSLVVGPRDGHVSRLASKARRANPFLVFVGQGWARSAPMPSRDFARCVTALLQQEEFPTGSLGLGGRERLTAMEILQRLLAHYGRRKVNVHVLESVARAVAGLLESAGRRPSVSVARLSWLLENRVPASNAARGLLGRFPRRFEAAFGYSPASSRT